MKNQILKPTLLSVLILGVLHHVGSFFYFYWSVIWFDSVVHFVGGVAIGFLFIYLYQKISIFGVVRVIDAKIILYTFVFTMLIGIGWEKFEYVYDIANAIGEDYLTDTTYDLLADGIGAILAGFIGRSLTRHE